MCAMRKFVSNIVLTRVFKPQSVKIVLNFSASVGGMDADNAKAIFFASVDAVKPLNLLKNAIKVEGDNLVVKGKNYVIKKPCYIIGFGKAVLGMAVQLEAILGANLKEGIVTVPVGIFDSHSTSPSSSSKLRYIEGARNNLPDLEAMTGAESIKNLAEKLNEDDLVIILVSGGGSALLPLPKEPITLQEKLILVKSLAQKGADIMEVNCVRKKISNLKGGRLAEFVYPARAVTLILSDVVGDPIDYIASGPTVPNIDGEDAALKIVKKYSLFDGAPESVKKILLGENNAGKTVPIEGGNFTHVDNFILGNNKMAAEASRRKAEELGYSSAILSTKLTGDVEKLGKVYAKLARILSDLIGNPSDKTNLRDFLQKEKENLQLSNCDVQAVLNLNLNNTKGVCLIGAGEPTVRVAGKGLGGRNQQLALGFSLQLNKSAINSANISFLSCGTDGIDGPTDAAGAIGFSTLVHNALLENINPQQFLDDNDCYNFFSSFKNGEYLVKTGHTGTNVMDVHLLIVSPKICEANPQF